MKNLMLPLLISGSALLSSAPIWGQTFPEPNMPVVLSTPDHSQLTAYPENTAVILRWSTGNERGVDRYVIEHSTDSTYFNPLHEVISRGDIDQDSAYRDIDAYPSSSTNYYRLKTVLSNGEALYSPIVRVDLDSRKTPVLKPTVLHMGSTIRMDSYHEQPLTVNFFNANGILMGSFIVNSTSFDIPTTGWNKGLFFYRISDATHPLITAGKIIIL
ncbi:MAG TPA: hypothetical protein VI233_02930 [Puia sp.]